MNTTSKIAVGGTAVIAIALALVYARGHMITQSSKDELVSTVSYACNDAKTIISAVYKDKAVVALSDGRLFNLPQTISADGNRYANADESFVFWGKGNGALVLEHNQEKSYIGCVRVVPQPTGSDLTQIYASGPQGFSIRLPEGYTPDESYTYEALGPGKDISGIKFTIPASLSTGTNLSVDSYISVEEIPKIEMCSAGHFIYPTNSLYKATEGDIEYSIATSSDAGLGNRYEETVYAIPGTNPCLALRYFIHYGVFENYPPGAVKHFDKDALLGEFDAIRRTLVVNQ